MDEPLKVLQSMSLARKILENGAYQVAYLLFAKEQHLSFHPMPIRAMQMGVSMYHNNNDQTAANAHAGMPANF